MLVRSCDNTLPSLGSPPTGPCSIIQLFCLVVVESIGVAELGTPGVNGSILYFASFEPPSCSFGASEARRLR